MNNEKEMSDACKACLGKLWDLLDELKEGKTPKEKNIEKAEKCLDLIEKVLGVRCEETHTKLPSASSM